MPGQKAVAVDVIALLAGVNYGSVIKVISAIEAMRVHTDLGVEEIVKFTDAPTEPVRFDGRHEKRICATDQLVRAVVINRDIEFLDYVLRHKARFGNGIRQLNRTG